jgi:UDP-N-acetylmuramyl pentapeptide phosphotransferase/UDP-N-acetylglucosamine-1-phosphate transferase
MSWLFPACVTVAIASALAIGALRTQLQQRSILDHPNERSSHKRPTPRGGGLVVVPIILIAWAVYAGVPVSAEMAVVIPGAAALALLSWIDDLRTLPASVRLIGQAAVVAAALSLLDGIGPVFQGLLPPLMDKIIVAFAWIWFINLFNFMDGIDGISGVEAISIGGGLAALALMTPAAMPNWHPARIFLGDVGSVPIGFLLGFLLLTAAANGYWATALILPLYYLADATLTLLRRAARGEKVWHAHREHFYQKSVQGGRSHAVTCGAILTANLILIALAWTAMSAPALSLAGAAVVVVLLLLWMQSQPSPR